MTLHRILQLLSLSCRHRHITKPFSAARAASDPNADWDSVAEPSAHYVVCLDCGSRLAYDWDQMRIVG